MDMINFKTTYYINLQLLIEKNDKEKNKNPKLLWSLIKNVTSLILILNKAIKW